MTAQEQHEVHSGDSTAPPDIRLAEKVKGIDWKKYFFMAMGIAFFCLVYPVVASRGMDFDDPRQLGLIEAQLAGWVRAARELDLHTLVERQ